MMSRPDSGETTIYLDYNATTPVDPRVLDAMLPYLGGSFGNASSAHGLGRKAHEAVERARGQVAQLIGAHADEILFTGGGSESDNLAIQGVLLSSGTARPHMITSAVEHPAVLETARYWQHRWHADVTIVPVDNTGAVDPAAIREAIRPETVLVSIMHANNEVGTVQPLTAVAALSGDAIFHSDAAQSCGKIPVNVDVLGVDLLTIAGHKLYAPKGIGALYIRRGTRLDPVIHGAGQERGLRAGTENVASIVGLGTACEIALTSLKAEGTRLAALRDLLQRRLVEKIQGAMVNGNVADRLPNTLNISLPGIIGQDLLDAIPGIAASTGAACHAGTTTVSPVLAAMGLTEDRALGALRLSLGRWTTELDVEQAAQLIADAAARTRSTAYTSRVVETTAWG